MNPNLNAERREEAPFLARFDCRDCEAFCCYDGVYVTEEEERRIVAFCEEHPALFAGLPRRCFEDGRWPGMKKKRKTATVGREYDDPRYPAHFGKTRCVFCDDGNRCLLQVAAEKVGLDPWEMKPRSCWLFPLCVGADGNISPPPTINEDDEDNLSEAYPGFVSCMPCVVADPQGVSWRVKYRRELIRFSLLA